MLIHPSFKLNGTSFSEEDLTEVAYSLVKEGDSFEKPIGDFLVDWLSTNETVHVKTSGSTGQPKSIWLEKRHMVNSALATGAFFNIKEGNTALLCLNCEYIAGKMMLVRALVLGLELDYVVASSNPLKTAEKQYDFCAMVPLQVENSLSKLDNLKTLIIGGAAVSETLKRKLKGSSTQVFETYGMTETITHIAIKSIEETYFRVLSDVHIKKDARDCLVIDAPKIADNEIVTNDVVELVSKSQFKLLGRFDNIINSGGVKLIPEEIERKLSGLISNRFFVAGIPDESLGQKLVLYVEGKVQDGFADKIKHSRLLGKFEVPKKVVFIDEFVETGSGKIDRAKTLLKAG